MIWLLLSIFLTSSLILFFKLFEKFNVNTMQALVANYITAASLGLLFSQNENKLQAIIHAEWLFLAIPLGFLFISIFYTVSVTAVKLSVSAATVANKMSVIMPVCAAFYFYGEKITFIKITGILLALAAVILTSMKGKSSDIKHSKTLYFLPVIVFAGSGMIDVIVNFVQNTYLQGTGSDIFLGTAFFTAGIIGSVIVCIQLFNKKRFEWKNIAWGVSLGIPNYFSIYTLIKALDSGKFESSSFFPINNIGIVVVSALAAYWLFKEKLSVLNIAGIGIALLSIILIGVNF